MLKMFTGFSKEARTAFGAQDRPGAFHMLNLIRLSEKATYPEGRITTGAHAYAEYGRISTPVLQRVHGRIVWRGNSN